MTPTRIVGHIVFSGGLNPDPDAAEIDLRRAGFTVARPPARDQFRIALHTLVSGDDFIQAYIDVDIDVTDDASIDAVRHEINRIVNRHGGTCMEWGAEPPDYQPTFDHLFK
jgi:hypothetical protein